jgi:hypothetical protein
MGSPVGAAGGGVNSQSVGVANIDAQQANISSASTAGSSGVGGNNALGSSGLAQSAESASSSLGSVSQTAGSTASALAGLNAEIPYTSQAFGGLSSILPNVAQGFGQLSAQVPAVNAEFGSLESSLGGFSSRVNEINFEAFNQGIRSIGDSAASLKQILGTPIKIDISGQIDAPQINTTVNVDSASVVSAIQALSTKITQDITAWTRRIESQLQRLASQVASATNAANNRKM